MTRHAHFGWLAVVRAARPTLVLVILLLALVRAAPVEAHSLRVASEPAAGAMVAAAPTRVTITFGEAPDPALSRIEVHDAAGRSLVAGPVTLASDLADTLAMPVAPVAEDVVTVDWTAVSAVDGHVSTGSFTFGVGVPPPVDTTAEAGTAVPVTPGLVVGGWLLSLGLLLLLGAAVLTIWVTRGPWAGAVPLLAGAWWVAVVGAGILTMAQSADAGVGLGAVLASSRGAAVVGRALPLVVAAAGIVLLWRRPGRSLAGAWAVLAGGGLAMLSEAASSHAAAQPLPWLAIAVQWLHLAAAGAWLGGLAALLTALVGWPAGARGSLARRFSGVALVGLVGVGASGVVRAAGEVGSLDGLLATDYGRVVLLKAVLLAVLVGLGALQRRRALRTSDDVALPVLRRIGSVEVAIAVVAVLLAATLATLVPPASVGRASPESAELDRWTGPRAATGIDAAGTLRATLRLSPGTAGFDTFLVDLVDAAGSPVSGATVALRFALPVQPDLVPTRLSLGAAGDGRYLGSSASLSVEGTWSVTTEVARGGVTVEVPLLVRTAIPVQHIDVVRTTGLPDISTVHLVGGGTLQVYVDPGRAGDNAVHATFFDATGGELPVTQAWLGVVLPPASPEPAGSAAPSRSIPAAPPPPMELDSRLLEPGHMVGSVTLPAGDALVVVSAQAPDGAYLSAQVPVSVVP